MSDIALKPNCATLVPEDRRQNFLPTLFSLRWLLRGENAVYDFMGALSPDYGGGCWQFFELDGQPLYMAPERTGLMRIQWEGNGYEGEVSPEAAGIIATLFALSHLSMHFGSDHLAEGFHRLRDYVSEHPEAAEIFAAID